MARIDPELQKQIIALCQHAAQLAEMREYAFALSKYYDALAMVPDPKQEYKAATWIYSSIGQVHMKKRDFNEAGRAFLQAYRCVGGEQSAAVNFRLGQCLVECGGAEYASQYLCQAYMLDGEHPFSGEDPKYFDVIRHEVEGAKPEPEPQEDDPEELLDSYELLSQLAGGNRHPYAEPVVVDEGPDEREDDRSYRVKAGQRYRMDGGEEEGSPKTPRTARYDDGWRSPRGGRGERSSRLDREDREGREERAARGSREDRDALADIDEAEDTEYREDRPRTGRAGLPVGEEASRAQRSRPMPAHLGDDEEDEDDEYRPNIWGRILDFIDRFR